MASDDLNYRQRMFIEAYLGKANGNASEAARMAGYAHPLQQGPRLLGKVGIQAAIAARVATAGLSANEVLARLAEVATGDMTDFIKVDSRGRPSVDLKRAEKSGKLRLVKSLKPGKFGIAIELHDPVAALVQMGKYHGLWDGDKAPKSPDGGSPKRIILPGGPKREES